MSKIIRSLDLSDPKIRKFDLHANPIRDASLDRAKGGVNWITALHTRESAGIGSDREGQGQSQSVAAARRGKNASEKIQERGYHEGFAQGEAAGRKLAQQKVEPILTALSQLVENLAHEREHLAERYEAELIRLAFLMATKIVHHEICTNDETIIGVARDALGKVIRASRITIKVSPYDMETIQAQINESGRSSDWLPESINLESDIEMTRGGCKLITDCGEIDASIESQIHLLKSILWT